MGRISAAFTRLSPREKLLVSALGVTVVLLTLFFVNMALSDRVTELEDNVAAEQDHLRQIYAAAPSYVAGIQSFEEAREQARENAELNLTEALANIGRQISFEAVDRNNQPLGRKRLDTVLNFAPPKRESLQPKRRASNRDRDEPNPLEGYHRRDLEVQVGENVPFETLYAFMAKVEAASEHLFVTEVQIERNRHNDQRAGRGKIVVSTFFYETPEEE